MAKRISSTAINWTAFREFVPNEELPKFLALKAKNDYYVRRVAAYPAELPQINWNYYKSKIAVPGLVDDFQKKYEGLKFPYPTDQGLISKIDEQEKEMKAALANFIEKTNKVSEDASKEFDILKAQIPVSELTLDEFFHLYPDKLDDFLCTDYRFEQEDEEDSAH